MNLDDFLKAFFPDENEQIYFRAFKPKDAPDNRFNSARKISFCRRDLRTNENLIELRKLNHHRGIYFVVNSGGDNDEAIHRYNAVFTESDAKTIDDQNRELDACPLPTSIRVETKRSIHAHWLLQDNITGDQWRDLQNRLIAFFGNDTALKNPSRLMRVPGFQHLTYNPASTGVYDHKLVDVIQFNPERRYSLKELQNAFPPARIEKPHASAITSGKDIIQNGSRNSTLCSLAGTMRNRGMTEGEIVTAIREVNRQRVSPPLPDTELQSIARSIARYEAGKPSVQLERGKADTTRFDEPKLSDEALYGLAGEIVRTIEPHTESSNAALLVQLLAGFGSLIGKTAYFVHEADAHFTKVFTVLVGASSQGRKGTSWGRIRQFLVRVDESFQDVIQDGLSSGEGLIYHVRDPHVKKSAIKEGTRIVDYQEEIIDHGANEKRVFVIEPEFARVLRVMNREGNILSSVIRQAWDSDRLKVMTKNPLKASDTHISIVGHITKEELLRSLDETETVNGFANRFLWIYTTRSKYLPEGGKLTDSELSPLIKRLQRAVENARLTSEMKRDEYARRRWIEVYEKLADGPPGLLGALTRRAAPQVMRLASLYALLDMSEEIGVLHLEAALALWQYSEDSARYIFGNKSGNKIADEIYRALKESARGLSRTELSNLFSRNRSGNQIEIAIKTLLDLGKITTETVQTEGRPKEVFKVVTNEIDEKNEISLMK